MNPKLIDRTLILLSFALATGCGGHPDLSNGSPGNPSMVKDSVSKAGGSAIPDTASLSGDGTIHGVQQEDGPKADSASFFRNCNDWQETSFGALMGLEDRGGDPTGNICFYANYAQPETYEILFLYKGGAEKRKEMRDSIVSVFDHECKTLYPHFDCYTFVHKMKDPNTMNDMHESKYVFPTDARAYKRISGDLWVLLWKKRVRSYTEFRHLEFNTIYRLK